jgi:ribose 5-phosphate isomerase B
MSKLHNNANILTLGGRMIGEDLAQEIVLTWINTDFEGGRHQRRIDMLDELPKESWIKFTGGK